MPHRRLRSVKILFSDLHRHVLTLWRTKDAARIFFDHERNNTCADPHPNRTILQFSLCRILCCGFVMCKSCRLSRSAIISQNNRHAPRLRYTCPVTREIPFLEFCRISRLDAKRQKHGRHLSRWRNEPGARCFCAQSRASAAYLLH